MATHKSAMKRNKQNLKKNERNRNAKSEMRSAMKDLREAAASGKKEDLQKKFQAAQKLIASTASRGVIAATTGARYISRLASLVGKTVSKTK
ncbi:MAG: 30S ribosomal protein S20 [Proteobacteria bacterium]|nr:30S ribosomal protein S20 [Pseudomonadota bacterium]